MAKRKVFVPPTVEDVTNYCKEGGYDVSPEAFVNHYESVGWMIGRSPMKDWKSSVRMWNLRAREKKSSEQEEPCTQTQGKSKADGAKLSKEERVRLESSMQKVMLTTIDLFEEHGGIEKCESPIERQFLIEFFLIKYMDAVASIFGLGNKEIIPQKELADLPYRVDFMLYDYHSDTHVVVELDGREYHHVTKEQVNYDYKREREIKKAGFDIIRYTGSEIYADALKCAKEAYDYFIKRCRRGKEEG